MNYQKFASYENKPPFYNKQNNVYYDKGNGVPPINENNMTVQDIHRTSFLFLNDHNHKNTNAMKKALKGIQCNSELSKLYFSDTNIKRLQKMMKKEVYIRTNKQYKLDIDQDQQELFGAMRSVYMEHGRFLPGQIVRQIKQLNQEVINEQVPSMIEAIKREYGYLKEINEPIKPIMRPVNVNNAGRLTLPSVTTVLGMY